MSDLRVAQFVAVFIRDGDAVQDFPEKQKGKTAHLGKKRSSVKRYLALRPSDKCRPDHYRLAPIRPSHTGSASLCRDFGLLLSENNQFEISAPRHLNLYTIY